MLSRTADHLYWMSPLRRARREPGAHARCASPPVAAAAGARGGAAGLERDAGLARHDGGISSRSTTRCRARVRRCNFLAFDRESSRQHRRLPARGARKCPRRARHDHLGACGRHSTPPTSNRTGLRRQPAAYVDVAKFIEWVKYRSHLTRGVTVGTMLRDEAFHFASSAPSSSAPTPPRACSRRAGAIRAAPASGWPTEASEWAVLLRAHVRLRGLPQGLPRIGDALAGHRAAAAQCRTCRVRCTAASTTCSNNLGAVHNNQSAETERYAGELHARFHYGRLEELCAGGVPQFLDRSPGAAATAWPTASVPISWWPGYAR